MTSKCSPQLLATDRVGNSCNSSSSLICFLRLLMNHSKISKHNTVLHKRLPLLNATYLIKAWILRFMNCLYFSCLTILCICVVFKLNQKKSNNLLFNRVAWFGSRYCGFSWVTLSMTPVTLYIFRSSTGELRIRIGRNLRLLNPWHWKKRDACLSLKRATHITLVNCKTISYSTWCPNCLWILSEWMLLDVSLCIKELDSGHKNNLEAATNGCSVFRLWHWVLDLAIPQAQKRKGGLIHWCQQWLT